MLTLSEILTRDREQLQEDLAATKDKALQGYITGHIDRINIMLPKIIKHEEMNRIKLPYCIEKERF